MGYQRQQTDKRRHTKKQRHANLKKIRQERQKDEAPPQREKDWRKDAA